MQIIAVPEGLFPVAHRGTDVHYTPFLCTLRAGIFLFLKKINLPKYFPYSKTDYAKKTNQK
jgi:hypothetical protein